jgi:hypothetical protein
MRSGRIVDESLMRRSIALLLLASCTGALAQVAPPKLEPLPPPPPMPAGAVDEPRVRIPVQEGDRVEEMRENGRIVMLKVTPPGGTPYYLVDTAGTGAWSRRDVLPENIRVPMWQLRTWD